MALCNYIIINIFHISVTDAILDVGEYLKAAQEKEQERVVSGPNSI